MIKRWISQLQYLSKYTQRLKQIRINHIQRKAFWEKIFKNMSALEENDATLMLVIVSSNSSMLIWADIYRFLQCFEFISCWWFWMQLMFEKTGYLKLSVKELSADIQSSRQFSSRYMKFLEGFWKLLRF